jgi:hypothetical protein
VAILNKKTKVSDEIPSFVDGGHRLPAADLLPGDDGVPEGPGLQIVLPEEAEEEVEVPQRNILHINVQTGRNS